MSIQVKICGLTTFDAVRSAVKSGANYIGFVFYPPSPRNVSPKQADILARHIPLDIIKKVAVTVDANDEDFDAIFMNFKPDMLQCHGNETPDRIETIKSRYNIPVIKSIPVRSGDDIRKSAKYEDIADMILFDAKAPDLNMPGGNGLSFDWRLLQGHDFKVPWFLSGGLNIQNIRKALSVTDAQMVDVSSSLESEPGVKDPELISLFMQKTAAVYA